MEVLSVVPIFMSAGAAALPTILAAVTSVTAILFRPVELLRLIRRYPKTSAGSGFGLLLGLLAGGWYLFAEPAQAHRADHMPQYDWVKVAEGIIAQEKAGKSPTAIATQVTNGSALVFGRDFSRCGYDGGVSPVGLKLLWSYRPAATMFLSVPVVAGNRIFAAGTQVDTGGYFGLLSCLDAATGKVIWEITKAGDENLRPFFSSPAISADGKSLVIGQGFHEDANCKLMCFDTMTGALKWHVDTTLHIESSPAILGDVVVAGAGAIEGPDGKATGDPGHVIAVRISDGKELWRIAVNDPESSPAIAADGTVYIGSGFNGSAMVGIHAADPNVFGGQVAWKQPVAYPVTGAITLAEDLVIAGAGNSDYVYANPMPRGLVIALDRKGGAPRWATPFPDAVLGAVSYRNGVLICPVRTGEVAALSAADGHVIWRTPISGSTPVLAACAFTGTHVYAVSRDGYLVVLDAKDGKPLEKVYLNDAGAPGEGRSFCSPQVVGGRVIVGSETGGLRCFIGGAP